LSLPTASVAGVVTYTGKTTNQFIGVDTARDALSIGDDVRYNNVAYGYSFANNTKKIEVLITGVLKDFPIPDTTFYFNKGDKVRVGSFGINKSIFSLYCFGSIEIIKLTANTNINFKRPEPRFPAIFIKFLKLS